MTETPNLDAVDAQAAAVQKTPNRVTLDNMKARIVAEEFIQPKMLPTMLICVLQVENGFVLVGKAGAVDPENYDEKLCKQYAYEDALRQMWPLEAYLLCERMRIPGEGDGMSVEGE